MDLLKTIADTTVDKLREVAASYEDNNLSTGAYRNGENVGPPKIESGYYSTGRMEGFGSDSVRHCGYGRDDYNRDRGFGGGGYTDPKSSEIQFVVTFVCLNLRDIRRWRQCFG